MFKKVDYYRIFTVFACFMFTVILLLFLFRTESGGRIIKDLRSEVDGGILRHVRVYDINGKLIEEYKGKFDIETNKDNYILFDDENNLRHIVYYTTGTIFIDELKDSEK